MNYLKQINAFMVMSPGRIKTTAQLVYLRLLDMANRDGRPEWFEATDASILWASGIGHARTLKTARSELIEAGFIEYKKGGSGVPSQYHIVDLTGKSEVKSTVKNTCNITPSESIPVKSTVKTTVKSTPRPTSEASIHAASGEPKGKGKGKDTEREINNSLPPLSFSTGKYHESITDFQSSIRPVKGVEELEQIVDLCDEFGEAAFIEAVATTRKNGGRSLNYVATVLRGNQQKGSVSSAREDRERRQRMLEKKWNLPTDE